MLYCTGEHVEPLLFICNALMYLCASVEREELGPPPTIGADWVFERALSFRKPETSSAASFAALMSLKKEIDG